MKNIIIILLLGLIGQSCSSKSKIQPQIDAIQKILKNSEYSFEQKGECNCRLKGPSVWDAVGNTQWDFNLQKTIQIIDTFLTWQVRLKYKNSEDVNVKVLEWNTTDMSPNCFGTSGTTLGGMRFASRII